MHNGQMFGKDKDMTENLKDMGENSVKDALSLPVPYKKNDFVLNSYPKLSKLITALYIVTDIIDKEEPVRLKLRTFGAEILSDINSTSRTELSRKIQIILSFLDIALSVNLISEMNFNILKKEFNQLNESLEADKESSQINYINHAWLEEFLQTKESFDNRLPSGVPLRASQSPKAASNKGFTATSALNKHEPGSYILRKQRRDDIIKAIVGNGGSATITEVKINASLELKNCGEKTLQRELVSMVKEGLLTKEGEKRWSRYSVINPSFNRL
jgi:hypothetical protein